MTQLLSIIKNKCHAWVRSWRPGCTYIHACTCTCMQVLCCIKAYNNGVVDITPGFSPKPPIKVSTNKQAGMLLNEAARTPADQSHSLVMHTTLEDTWMYCTCLIYCARRNRVRDVPLLPLWASFFMQNCMKSACIRWKRFCDVCKCIDIRWHKPIRLLLAQFKK